MTVARSLISKLWIVALALASYLVASQALDATPLGAHNANVDFYISSGKWASDPKIRLGNLDNDLDGNTSKRNQTKASAEAVRADLSNMSGSTFDITSVYWNYGATYGGVCSSPSGVITVVSSNISPLGRTEWCLVSGTYTLDNVVISIDYRAWDPGGTVPSNKWDFHGVLMHEVVHATGWGLEWRADHFVGSSACPSNVVLRQTMCPSYSIGHVYWRSLESHDIHTIQGAY